MEALKSILSAQYLFSIIRVTTPLLFASMAAVVIRRAGIICIAFAVSYTHLRAHETGRNLVCRLLLEKKKT